MQWQISIGARRGNIQISWIWNNYFFFFYGFLKHQHAASSEISTGLDAPSRRTNVRTGREALRSRDASDESVGSQTVLDQICHDDSGFRGVHLLLAGPSVLIYRYQMLALVRGVVGTEDG